MKKKITALLSWLRSGLDAFTQSYTLRLFRDLEPAFVIFTVIGVIIATIALWLDLSARQEERISRAWQTVSSSAQGNTGKADALKFLAAMDQDLRWMHLAPGSTRNDQFVDCSYRVFVPALNLKSEVLDNSNLSCCDFDSHNSDTITARFDGASLHNTSWIRTKAERASFRNASLISADFRGARLGRTDFSGADLTQVRFSYADLQGATLNAQSMLGVSAYRADFRNLSGVSCEELRTIEDWKSTCRDSHLECGEPSETKCGPGVIPPELRIPVVDSQANTGQSTPDCDAVGIQREIAFRLDQVDKVVDENFVVDGRNESSYCTRARMIFVVANLGGISRRPPPKEDETVWIGGSGYGYRHTPFKTGSRSSQFASFNLPELVDDYLKCTSNAQSDQEGTVQVEVDRFETTAASNVGKVKECDKQWIEAAEDAWRDVRRRARALAGLDEE